MFHVIHLSEDLTPLDAWYDRVFAPRRGVMDTSYSDREMRWGSLLVIGDAVIEDMAPGTEEGAAAMPIGRFFTKFGRHWHSLAWYTDDVGAIWDRLVDHGIRVITPGPDPGARPEEGDIYTHPKDTGTQLEFYQPDRAHGGPQGSGVFPDPRFMPGWEEVWAATPNPLGIERLAYVTVLCGDLDHSGAVYVDAVGGTALGGSTSALCGTESRFVAIGPETVVELARPTDPGSLAGADMARHGEICHAVAFTVADLDRAAAHLEACGVGLVGRDETTLLADPADTFGAPFRFTTERVAGDPRD
ncbi:MAG TPA: hypothetical protein VKG43_06005 [Acidimicrobiales bacterium]|nr:hypothetical protein [Acidimicrobiales bacterium]